MKQFRESLKSQDTFVSDEKAELAKLYDVKAPLVNIAMRNTFVIGPGRKVLEVQSGGDAINPDAAVRACPLHKKTEPAKDAGTK